MTSNANKKRKPCPHCPKSVEERNFARHMRNAHHVYECSLHGWQKANTYPTKNRGELRCGCDQQLRLGKPEWWRTWNLAKQSLAKSLEAEVGEQADVVQQAGDDVEQTPNEHELDGNVDAVQQPAPVENGLEGNGDVGRMPDENGLEDVDAVQQATADENGLEDVDGVQQAAPERNANVVYQAAAVDPLPSLQGLLIADQPSRFRPPVEPTAKHLDKLLERRCQEIAEKELEEQAAEADAVAQETFDKALSRHRVTTVACIREMDGVKSIGWTPGSRDVTYGGKAVCSFDTVCIVSEFAATMARLLEHRDQARPLVLFLRGQSGSGKTWLPRKLLEPLEGAQVSITSVEGAAAPRILPKDKAKREMITPKLLDFVARWSKAAKMAANESSSRAVVAYSMDGLLLIDMPGGEEMEERSAETRMINTTNMEVLATLDAFHCGKFCRSFERNHAVKFVLDALKKARVRVLVATVVRDTDRATARLSRLWRTDS
ncbi:hypothetical protein FN846DRAFT_1019359 [Sphaerosporella brunnea]|uniref:Uncharacterized protein n=1 Tax=Sphaerosporella brunnea TaxID=1250544 RepID=A0A5J5F6I2_9PEZI|nr:hypothetical protein FN846DRAFT_1019359 [Sphaerosporella brunnea]